MIRNRVFINSDDPLVRLERFKLMAQGCQVLAIGVLVASIVAPIFNAALKPSLWLRAEGGIAAAILEWIGLHLIGYMTTRTGTGGQNG